MAAAPRAPGSSPAVFGLSFRSFFTMFFRVERGKNDTEEPHPSGAHWPLEKWNYESPNY